MTNQAKQLVICPSCQGVGSVDGRVCQNCGGVGLGQFFGAKFLYWRKTLDISEIKHGRSLRRINNYLTFVLIFSIAINFFIFLFWFYSVVGVTNLYQLGSIKSAVLILFWANIFFIFALASRLDREQDTAKIAPLKKSARAAKSAVEKIPNNWIDIRRYGSNKKINVRSGFGKKASEVLEEAALLSMQLKSARLMPIHLFFSTLRNADMLFVFFRLNIDIEVFMEKLSKYLAREKIVERTSRMQLPNLTKEVLINAYAEALAFKQQRVLPINFLLACFDAEEIIQNLFADLGVTREKLANCLSWLVFNQRINERIKEADEKHYLRPSGDIDKAYTAVATPFLDSVGTDLTLMAKHGQLELCVAREKELNIVMTDFENGFNSIILIGLPGVGRGTIINGVAELMYEEDVPEVIKDKRLMEVDISRLIGGFDITEAQDRLIHLLNEVIRAGNVVLSFSKIEDFVNIASNRGTDLIKILQDYVTKKNFFCLIGSDEDFYYQNIESLGLKKDFELIKVVEPTDNQAIIMIESQIAWLESKHQSFFSYNAIESSVELSAKYIHEKYLPQKAIDILEYAAMSVTKSRGINTIVDIEDIMAVISELVGIPPSKLSMDESSRLLNLEELLHKRVIGQNKAILAVSAALRRARAELKSDQRPIASFLFLGPTGVGKTELAKAVANIYFGSDKFLTRFDMSEYQSSADIEKLIGSMNEKGHLTESVRGNPYSLLLLDEFEKAHADVHNLFLQVLDAGRLTDGQGKTIDFTNCIIIATSNIGSDFIAKSIFEGKSDQDVKLELFANLNRYLKTELINRFDDILVFDPLSLDNVRDIAIILLKEVEEMLKEKGIYMRVDHRGALVLARGGYSPTYGARQMRRYLQDTIENEIATKIIAGQLSKRDTVVINEDGKVEVEKARVL